MSGDNRLILTNKNETFGEPITDYYYDSFEYTYSLNSDRAISFKVLKTNVNRDAFDLIQNEAVLIWEGQRYVIKSTELDSQDNMVVCTVEAPHIMTEFQHHYIEKDLENEELNEDVSYDDKVLKESSQADEVRLDTDGEDNNLSYTLEQYLDFGFKNNKLGFTYKIIGKSKTLAKVESLGDKNGLEYLSEGAELFDYIYFADNKHFYIYIADSFYKKSESIIRYKYNLKDLKVSSKTTDIKTYIKGYGKKKTAKETKNYNPIKTPQLEFTGNFIKKGTWRTETGGASIEREFECKWGNETLIFNLKLGPKGGLWNTYLDNEYVGTLRSWSRTASSRKVVVSKGIKKGTHTFKAVFAGADSNINYKDEKPTGYVGTERTVILNLTSILKGEELYHYKAEYKSPNYSTYGHAQAATVYDDKVNSKAELLDLLKEQINDEPTVEVSTNYFGYDDINENSIVHMEHEPLGIGMDLKVVEMKKFHPLTKKPSEISFSNKSEDLLSIQRRINKNLKTINSKNFTSSITSTGSSNVGLNYDVVGSVAIE